jgi:hypothetical protein
MPVSQHLDWRSNVPGSSASALGDTPGRDPGQTVARHLAGKACPTVRSVGGPHSGSTAVGWVDGYEGPAVTGPHRTYETQIG